jgi:hypothetical protein
MQTLANQVGQALSGDAFSFRFDPVATALLADRIDEGCFRQIHNKPGSKTQAIATSISESKRLPITNDAHDLHDFGLPIDVTAPYQAFARFYSSRLVPRGRSFSSSELIVVFLRHGSKQYAGQKTTAISLLDSGLGATGGSVVSKLSMPISTVANHSWAVWV